jgi:hypothetical protein
MPFKKKCRGRDLNPRSLSGLGVDTAAFWTARTSFFGL